MASATDFRAANPQSSPMPSSPKVCQAAAINSDKASGSASSPTNTWQVLAVKDAPSCGLGIMSNAAAHGVVLATITPSSPFASLLDIGTVIVHVNGTRVHDPHVASKLMGAIPVGEECELTVREGSPRPSDAPAPSWLWDSGTTLQPFVLALALLLLIVGGMAGAGWGFAREANKSAEVHMEHTKRISLRLSAAEERARRREARIEARQRTMLGLANETAHNRLIAVQQVYQDERRRRRERHRQELWTLKEERDAAIKARDQAQSKLARLRLKVRRHSKLLSVQVHDLQGALADDVADRAEASEARASLLNQTAGPKTGAAPMEFSAVSADRPYDDGGRSRAATAPKPTAILSGRLLAVVQGDGHVRLYLPPRTCMHWMQDCSRC